MVDIDLSHFDNFILYVGFGKAPLFTFFMHDDMIYEKVDDRRGKIGMRRYFNTEGWCRPDRHYMVQLDKIKRLYVDREKYFVVNRGRQYGKTTTLKALAEYLSDDYTVISMDFQRISSASFADERMFVASFVEYMEKIYFGQKVLREKTSAEAFEVLFSLKEEEGLSLSRLFFALSRICETAKRPVVLMIDEVDNASNNLVFVLPDILILYQLSVNIWMRKYPGKKALKIFLTCGQKKEW